MPNKVEIIITADSQARKEITALNGDVRALSDRLDRAGASGTAGGRQIADGADTASSHVARTRVQVEQLSRDLDNASHHYRSLALSDGDVSDDRIKAALDRVRDLQSRRHNLLSQLTGAGKGAAWAAVDVPEFSFSALPAQLRPALVAAVAGAAPTIVNAISAAVLLGFGGAALGAGIASAVQSPEVKAAFNPLGDLAQTQFKTVGQAFQKPLIDAIHVFRRELNTLDLAGTIAPAAAAIEPLSAGLAGLAKSALPGIRHAIEASTPLLATLGEELPEIGSAVSDLGDAFADAGDEANGTLSDILNATEVAIGAVSNMVTVVATITGAFRDFRDWMADWNPFAALAEWAGGGEEVHGTIVTLNSATGDSANAMDDAARATQTYADALDELVTSLDTAWGKEMSLDEATLAWSNSLLALNESVDKNGKTLKENTEHGNANREAILRAADQAWDLFEAEVSLTGSVGDASAKLNANLAQLEANAIKAGLNKDQVRALLDQYRALAASPDIDKFVTVHTRYVGQDLVEQRNYGAGIQPRAGGGPVMAGQTYVVGEERPELFVPTTNGMILPRLPERSNPVPYGGSSWTAPGSPTVPHYTLGSDGSALGDMLMNLLASTVRAAGGYPELLGIKI